MNYRSNIIGWAGDDPARPSPFIYEVTMSHRSNSMKVRLNFGTLRGALKFTKLLNEYSSVLNGYTIRKKAPIGKYTSYKSVMVLLHVRWSQPKETISQQGKEYLKSLGLKDKL